MVSSKFSGKVKMVVQVGSSEDTQIRVVEGSKELGEIRKKEREEWKQFEFLLWVKGMQIIVLCLSMRI